MDVPYIGNPAFETEMLPMGYRAAESFVGMFSTKCDVYACSLTLHVMLTGKYPYPIEHPDAPYSSQGKELLLKARRQQPQLDMEEDNPLRAIIEKGLSEDLCVRHSDMAALCKAICQAYVSGGDEETPGQGERTERDASMRCDVRIETPEGNGFADVAGMEGLKRTLTRDYVKVLQNIELAKAYNITPPNMILFGPPGCGKTYIANKLAEECGIAYSYIKPSDLGSTFIHGTQGKVADLFEKAAQQAPCLLCIDEIDALLPQRGGVQTNNNQNDELAEWLTQLNECTTRGVYVVAMTNRIGVLDEAVIRRGRFDATLYVPLPSREERKQLFSMSLAKCPMAQDVDLQLLADRTEGYSSSDIVSVVKDAARGAFEQTLASGSTTPLPIDQRMLTEALSQTRPSVSRQSLLQYEQERERFEKGKHRERNRIGFQA